MRSTGAVIVLSGSLPGPILELNSQEGVHGELHAVLVHNLHDMVVPLLVHLVRLHFASQARRPSRSTLM